MPEFWPRLLREPAAEMILAAHSGLQLCFYLKAPHRFLLQEAIRNHTASPPGCTF